MQIAPNGNSTGANDPNFIHFDEEQAGTLLPNPPGYPFFLPSLQISPKGRLCFWNFPNKIFKAVVSNPANVGTSNYLRDGKNASNSNLFPPIPGDLGTNGKTNQYFWGACNSYFKVTADFQAEIVNQLVQRLYWGNVVNNPSQTMQDVYDGVVDNPAWILPEVGKYNTDTGAKPMYPWDWILYNAQYYVNKFLVRPYDVSAGPQYGDSWTGTLSKESEVGALPTWLTATNFFVQLQANPDFLQSVSNALPIVILTAASIVSAGLATPALAAVTIPAVGLISSQVKTANVVNAQEEAVTKQLQAGGATNLTEQVTAAGGTIATATGLDTEDLIYFGIGIIIIILIIVFYKRK